MSRPPLTSIKVRQKVNFEKLSSNPKQSIVNKVISESRKLEFVHKHLFNHIVNPVKPKKSPFPDVDLDFAYEKAQESVTQFMDSERRSNIVNIVDSSKKRVQKPQKSLEIMRNLPKSPIRDKPKTYFWETNWKPHTLYSPVMAEKERLTGDEVPKMMKLNHNKGACIINAEEVFGKHNSEVKPITSEKINRSFVVKTNKRTRHETLYAKDAYHKRNKSAKDVLPWTYNPQDQGIFAFSTRYYRIK